MDRIFLKVIINNLRINCRNYVRGTRLNPNPGIERQLKVLSDKKTGFSTSDEEYEDSEVDFMNVKQQYNHWEKEAIRHKEKISSAIVKNKYFKEKLPNFLTWSEKEQIRHLFNEDPDEWNLEKLAESFPADFETIAKVAKSKWSPINEKRILKHDNVVKQNWELFKQNQININSRLASHLKRFVNRKDFQGIDLQSINLSKSGDLLKLHEPKSNEFSSIITGFNAAKSKEITEKLPNTIKSKLLGNQMNIKIAANNKPITLSQLKLQENQDLKTDVIVSNLTSDKNVNIHFDQDVDLVKANDTDDTQLMVSEIENANIIKERIKIPKEFWKEGATYRVKDCFYHSDGEFLYRVPGMDGTS